MSVDAHELGAAAGSTERDKARRFLLGGLTMSLALMLVSLGGLTSLFNPLGLVLHILPLVLIIASVILQWSPPVGAERSLTPRNLRRLARRADVPELGAMVMVYGGLLGALISTTAVLIIYMGMPPT